MVQKRACLAGGQRRQLYNALVPRIDYLTRNVDSRECGVVAAYSVRDCLISKVKKNLGVVQGSNPCLPRQTASPFFCRPLEVRRSCCSIRWVRVFVVQVFPELLQLGLDGNDGRCAGRMRGSKSWIFRTSRSLTYVPSNHNATLVLFCKVFTTSLFCRSTRPWAIRTFITFCILSKPPKNNPPPRCPKPRWRGRDDDGQLQSRVANVAASRPGPGGNVARRQPRTAEAAPYGRPSRTSLRRCQPWKP